MQCLKFEKRGMWKMSIFAFVNFNGLKQSGRKWD